jgi:exodeoxyribonuclease-1
MLYDGFLSDTDRALCQRVVEAPPETLGEASWPFEDSRLPELLFRYRARNFPDSLNAEDRARWRDHCHQQWHAGAFTLESFHRALAEEQAQPELSGETRHALDELAAWVAALSVAA